ncbi:MULTISPECIES: aldehyde dehydrogenase [unclassified Pantoea]|uniref:aldehyde dehydrogenase family protein n=1 Tax=unclassified Pantoea TaxID=2630326 RepID=UPI0012329945|nr:MULTISPECIES: aldehyde dehydrogenase family protein [unclassified Pantoea]KAA5970247.1 aldehyde dehydrogenase [Pantoea sp. M_6]KAA5976357.1 aldehyde dehydrogenase [Pantoea sp. M_8]KAA5987642.1 aldehyde dehydrogenase [Pantoea sp. M_10]KAA5992902.1 aldehyde dehydrogenase [Pantoea sp. M_5]
MLSFDPENVSLPAGHYIGGQHVQGQGALSEVKRPSDGRVYAQLRDATPEDVDHAVTVAHQALKTSGWSGCAPRERGRVLRRWADLIEQDPLLAQLEALGSTRPISDVVQHEIPFTAEAIRFYAECADKYSGDLFPTRDSSLGMLIAEPYGVIGAITPWNFPLSMASWKCGPALAAGNAVVLKPSELTPFSTVRMAELAIQAGLPAGVLNIVQGSGAVTGSALVKHPLVRKVSFTGSTQTGARIMSDAAQFGMKPVTLELGGKSPQLVFDDAGDSEVLAQRILRGFTANGGQACVAGTRLIVQRNIAEPLVERLAQLCREVKPGVTWQESSRYAPLIDARQGNKVSSVIEAAKAQGAEVIVGGARFADTDEGWFWQPTLLSHVTQDNPAVQQEIFGPVLTVQTFDDEEQGLAMAAHAIYGLCAGVHTLSLPRALRAMRAIDAGTVWINRYGRSGDFIIPTGGFLGSGIGKDLGRQAFQACQRQKSVLIDF